jgi:hypothetical protein
MELMENHLLSLTQNDLKNELGIKQLVRFQNNKNRNEKKLMEEIEN